LCLKCRKQNPLFDSFNRRDHAARILRLAPVREEVVRLTNCACAQIENVIRPDTTLDQSVTIGGSEIQLPFSSIWASSGVGRRELSRNVRAYFVATLPNAGANRRENVRRLTSEVLFQHSNGSSDDLSGAAAPTGMHCADCTFTPVKEQYRDAICGSDADGSSDFVREQSVTLRFPVLKTVRVSHDTRMYLP
jgi:hypothetical protein